MPSFRRFIKIISNISDVSQRTNLEEKFKEKKSDFEALEKDLAASKVCSRHFSVFDTFRLCHLIIDVTVRCCLKVHVSLIDCF